MKIAFDPQIFCMQEYGGVSRYFCALAEHLARIPGVAPRIIAPLHVNQYLKRMDKQLVLGHYLRPREGTVRVLKELDSLLFWPTAYLMTPDVVHETYYSVRPAYSARVPRVLTVYDMIHERFPEYYPASDRVAAGKRAAILRASHIFCISENTRRDLLDIYPLADERVTVTYLSHDMPASAVSAETRLAGSTPFLLYVGERKGYKNFAGFARAYASSFWLKSNFRVVCFGGGDISPEEREMLRRLDVPEAQLSHVTGGDDILADLYRAAAAFVYPSKYEGFGIPPLEAMALGCPVVCSRTSSIPEVVGEAGEYFDPDDVESLKNSLEVVLQSQGRREQLIQLGRERCRQFSWERCAGETLDAYKKLAP